MFPAGPYEVSQVPFSQDFVTVSAHIVSPATSALTWHRPGRVRQLSRDSTSFWSQEKCLLIWLPDGQQRTVDPVHVLTAPHPASSLTVFLHIGQYHVTQDALVPSCNFGLSEWEVTRSSSLAAAASGVDNMYLCCRACHVANVV